MQTIYETISLDTVTCYACAVVFAMPRELKQNLQTNGGTFYCPNGHGQCYTKPEVAKLREQLEAKERELRQAKCETLNERNQREAVEREKAKAERKLKRVQKGVCPCCNRSFGNLARHMATKHANQIKPT